MSLDPALSLERLFRATEYQFSTEKVSTEVTSLWDIESLSNRASRYDFKSYLCDLLLGYQFYSGRGQAQSYEKAIYYYHRAFEGAQEEQRSQQVSPITKLFLIEVQSLVTEQVLKIYQEYNQLYQRYPLDPKFRFHAFCELIYCYCQQQKYSEATKLIQEYQNLEKRLGPIEQRFLEQAKIKVEQGYKTHQASVYKSDTRMDFWSAPKPMESAPGSSMVVSRDLVPGSQSQANIR